MQTQIGLNKFQFFAKFNLRPFTEPILGHSGPWWYHIPGVLIGFFPWSIFMVPMLIDWARQIHRRDDRSILRAEMPAFQRVYDTYGADFLLLGVDVGPFLGLGTNQSAIDLLAELDLDGETVVLTRDHHAAAGEILHRVVRAVMTELHLHGAGATGESQTVNVRILERAATPEYPARPSKKRNTLLGILLGLSGGIDSSLLCAIAASLDEGRVEAFTLGFHEDRYDETPVAAAVANHNQSGEREVLTALDDLGYPVDIDDLLEKLGIVVIVSGQTCSPCGS